jgi:ABC-type nickel/cobalt efflux system permease component RcnA
MPDHSGILLIVTVAVVGVLHTIVPDHWAPIVVLARQQGWSSVRTARAAALAGLGHVTTTLLLGALLWVVGASLAAQYAHWVSLASALALIAFGLWIAYGGWKEAHEGENGHGQGPSHFEHAHLHRHADGLEHVHWHEHHEEDWHVSAGGVATTHAHDHAVAGRTALLLILGSSPMVEGIPAFLGASTKGPALLAIMAGAFALATIVTYAAMCVVGLRSLQRASFGPLERYGEVLSGLFVAAVGIYALLTSYR